MNVAPGRWVRCEGLMVAVLGFSITRLFVAEALLTETPLRFLVTGLAPLVLGFAVTVYGVALAVGDFDRSYVRTVAAWSLAGTAGMGVVLGLASLSVADLRIVPGNGVGLLVANVLLGGLVAGTLVGHRSAVNLRQRRELRRRANRARLVTRVLKHEVVNAATIVGGYAEALPESEPREASAVDAISEGADRIVSTVDSVDELTGDEDPVPVDVAATVDAEIERARERFPGATIERRGERGPQHVTADDRLGLVVRELLENAVHHGGGDVVVSVTGGHRGVTLSVTDGGGGMPADQRVLLESGAFPEYDDPASGFGLKVVRLLVARYDGSITVTSGGGDDGKPTTVSVTLPRRGPDASVARAVSVSFPSLRRAGVVGLLAGVVMGGAATLLTDFFPVIGTLYGVRSPVVGWVTHLFHSVVFALLFAAGHSHRRLRAWAGRPARGALTGVVWGVLLWLGAAGVLMPLWLRAVGVGAPLPNLPLVGLATHVLWGLVLGGSYHLLTGVDLALPAWARPELG